LGSSGFVVIREITFVDHTTSHDLVVVRAAAPWRVAPAFVIRRNRDSNMLEKLVCWRELKKLPVWNETVFVPQLPLNSLG
jgi:hypothetical protein